MFRLKNRLGRKLKTLLPAIALGSTALISNPALAQYYQIDKGGYPDNFSERNYVKLKEAPPTNFLDSIHYVPAFNGSYFTFGGMVRDQFWVYNNQRYGTVRNDVLLNHRLYLTGQYHVDEHLTALLTLGSFFSPGRNKPYGTSDVASIRVHNAFIDYNNSLGFADFAVRLGRQEFLFGSGRWLWNNNANNIPTTNDGVLASLSFKGGYSIQAFAARPTRPATAPFEDRTYNSDNEGLYVTTPIIKELTIDEYYMHWRRQTTMAGRSGVENNQLVGGRAYGKLGNFGYDADFAYNFGEFVELPISAYGAMGRLTYSFKDIGWKPLAGMQLAYFSGNSGGYSSRTIRTFTGPSARAAQLSYASYNAFSNLMHIYPYVVLNPTDQLAIRLGTQFNWRASVNDFVYVPGVTAVTISRNNTERYIGTNILGGVSYLLNPNTRIFAEYIHGFAGPALTASGGKSSDSGVLQVEVDF